MASHEGVIAEMLCGRCRRKVEDHDVDVQCIVCSEVVRAAGVKRAGDRTAECALCLPQNVPRCKAEAPPAYAEKEGEEDCDDRAATQEESITLRAGLERIYGKLSIVEKEREDALVIVQAL